MTDQPIVESKPVSSSPPAASGEKAPPPAATGVTPPAPPKSADGGATTLADGGGDTDKPQTTPANWPSNWREIMAGGDAKKMAKINRYQSPANILNAYMAIEQKLSAGELLRSKPNGEDQEAITAWRAQVGVPEKPEGYLEKLPDGLVIGKDDEELATSFLKDMHDADAPPGLVHKALAWYNNLKEKAVSDRFEEDKAHRVKAEDELRSEMGPEFRGNINGIHSLLDTYGTEGLKDKLFSSRTADGTLFGDDPQILRFLVGLSREINPQGIVTPSPGQTLNQSLDDEIRKLEGEQKDTRPTSPDHYWRNPAKQARLRELYQMQEKQKARATR